MSSGILKVDGGRTFGIPVLAGVIIASLLITSFLVYIFPVWIDFDTTGAFDAYAYVSYLNENPVDAREIQRFLWLYPPNVMPSWALNIYAVLLHLVLAVPVYIVACTLENKWNVKAALIAILSFESLLFIATASKEGLGLLGVFSAICFHLLINERRYKAAFFLAIYSVLLSELSRPKFGLIIAACLLLSLIPYSSLKWRRLFLFLIFIFASLVVWSILRGPFAESFAERYAVGRNFLEWFEVEMPSESGLKAEVRGFFSIIFAPEEPTLSFVLIAFALSVAKALVYLFALPIIALPTFPNLPAQTWALTWQLATTASVFLLFGGLVNVWRGRANKIHKMHAALLTFSVVLLYALALSTFIFHVRYRAPAIVSLLAVLIMIGAVRVRHVAFSVVFIFCFLIGNALGSLF